MNEEDVQGWLDRYVAAWKSYDPGQIRALFTADATYAYDPWSDPLYGADAIVEDWLKEQDPPDSWKASYRPLAVSDEVVVATGETMYQNGRTFSNIFVLRFGGDGRCADFVEWFMKHPAH